MFWALTLDDFTGNFCRDGPFPLMNAVKKELINHEPPVPTTKKLTATKAAASKTTKATKKSQLSGESPINSVLLFIISFYLFATFTNFS